MTYEDDYNECVREGHFEKIAVYNENCILAGRRAYPDDRSVHPCGYPHGDVHFVTAEEAGRLKI